MPRSKSGPKDWAKLVPKSGFISKVENSARYAKIKGAVLREILPEMYSTGVEKFYRGFSQIPADYVQTEPDFPIIMTKKDIKQLFDIDHVRDKKLHVMITGPPGSGKTTIVHRLANELFDTKVDFMEQDYTVFVLDMGQFNGNEIISVPQFLFNQNATNLSADLAEYLWCLTVTKGEEILFVLHNLDSAPYFYEADCQEIDPFVKSAPVSIIVHNLLKGVLFPKCKILSSMREHRLGKWNEKIRPDVVIKVGELSEHSRKTLMKNYFGKEHAEPVQNYWNNEAPLLCLLNKTTLYLTYSIMSVGMGEFYTIARTMPWNMVNLMLSCVYRQHFPKKPSGIQETVLAIFCKMKRLAYWGMIHCKYFFEPKEVTEKFGISLEDIENTLLSYPGRHESASQLLVTRPNGRYLFIEDHIMEFFCALQASELPIPDYKAFIEHCIHKPRFCVVRRILCSVILDPNVSELVRKERLRTGPKPDDFYLRQELLLESMSEEYHRVKRHELLEFFHAVRDCGEGGATIVPKEVDVIDLSHIQLYTMDCQAIGAALEHDVKVRYLNLANCIITPEGLRTLANKIAFTKTEIYRLNLDWNPGWQSYYTGKDGLCDIIKYCGVKDLGLNHCKLLQETLQAINQFLREVKIKVLRVQHNSSLDDRGYSVLGDFIMRHDVEHLYLTGKDVTCRRKANLHTGLTGYFIETGLGLTGKEKIAVAAAFELD